MNKQINGRQCTIGWHVDDLKISHVEKDVVEKIVDALQDRYGRESPLTVNRGGVHEYLGMRIDFSNPGKVVLSMIEYVKAMIIECPPELMQGSAQTPAASHLFNIREDAEKLDQDEAEIFHHLVAKILYLAKRTRPDLLLAVSFLSTRVRDPDVDDWKKLGRCITYLKDTVDLTLTLEMDAKTAIRWWVDASFAVHGDYKSHTGATMTVGKGCPINMSSKQKINTRSSTEAELVGVNDAMSLVLWVRMFLEAQGFEVIENVVFQDNQSTMLLEKNGRRSSGKRTRHIEIRYYFITDNIQRGNVKVEYCPTELMLADFFTKPLQGTLFRQFRARLLNMPHDPVIASQECVGTSTSGETRMYDDVERTSRPTDGEDKPTYADVASGKTKLYYLTEQVHGQSDRHGLTCLGKPK